MARLTNKEIVNAVADHSKGLDDLLLGFEDLLAAIEAKPQTRRKVTDYWINRIVAGGFDERFSMAMFSVEAMVRLARARRDRDTKSFGA